MITTHPKTEPPTVDPAQGAIPASNPAGRSRRAGDAADAQHLVDDSKSVVLLVDDQLMVGEMVRRALADDPNIVFHFCSQSGEAVTTAQSIAPTVILQDLVMPGIEGLTLVREYRALEATRNTPIIVLSTREDPNTKRDAFAAGASDYIVKLPDKIELIARIHYHSQAYLSRRQRDAVYAALQESQRQLLAANVQLLRLSNMDGLTGLNNRRRFDEYALAEWHRALRERTPLGLLLIDVDQFKTYNDTHGHLAGDELLRRIGAAICRCCRRPEDLPARYGGDEFAALLPGVQPSSLAAIGERLRQSVEDLQIERGGAFATPYVTLSIGGAVTVPTHEDGVVDLIGNADRNLYEAKAKGRNKTVVHE